MFRTICTYLSEHFTLIDARFARSSQQQTMVATPRLFTTSSSSGVKAKKNRRKITRKNPSQSHPSSTQHLENNEENVDDEPMIDMDLPPVAPGAEKTTLKSEIRRIPMPPHRMTPIKKDWLNIFGPLTEILGLQVRMNVHRRCVEIRVCFYLPKSEKPSKISNYIYIYILDLETD